MTFRITFDDWVNVTPPGLDGVKYGFPFLVISTELIGKPEEKTNTVSHRGLVNISRSRLVSWHLTEQDVPKVLFEFAKREIERLVATNKLPPKDQFTFPLLALSTYNAPDECPFDPSMIDGPNGSEMIVKDQEPIFAVSSNGMKRRLS